MSTPKWSCTAHPFARQNFHEFVLDRLQSVAEDRKLWLHRGLGGVVDEETGIASPTKCALTADEWDVAHLYAVYAFQKDCDELPPAARRIPERTPVIAYSDVKRIDASGHVVDV